MKKLAMLLVLCAGLAACGVKPSQVEPPEDARTTNFPRAYPDITTDP